MTKRFHFLILVFSVFLFEMRAQDPQFTQFYANPLYLNPAFAGTARCPRICLNYRNQWTALPGAKYQTSSASYDMHVDALGGGIGAIITTDDQAINTLRTTNASFIYSFLAPVSREFSLKFGLQATYLQKNIDTRNLTFGDMIDPRRGFVWNTRENIPQAQKVNVDFSAGVLGYSRHYFFGLGVHHINQPDEGLVGTSKLPAKFTAHAGAIIPLEKGDESFLSPNILFQAQQSFQQLNLGLYYKKSGFVAGLWYRTGDAVIALIGIQNSNFKFGYSYDITISNLAGNSGGSHELSIQLQFECKTKKKRYRTISCPSF
jgi:type IX secretion system PorP/SprF family membrane protein